MSIHPDVDFEDSRFTCGERVRVLLRSPKDGGVRAEATGVCKAREKNVDVSKDGETPRHRTLVWVKDIEGYTVPSEVPGAPPVARTEAWFDENALRKLDQPDLLDGVQWN